MTYMKKIMQKFTHYEGYEIRIRFMIMAWFTTNWFMVMAEISPIRFMVIV
jgi:hypothetical protein